MSHVWFVAEVETIDAKWLQKKSYLWLFNRDHVPRSCVAGETSLELDVQPAPLIDSHTVRRWPHSCGWRQELQKTSRSQFAKTQVCFRFPMFYRVWISKNPISTHISTKRTGVWQPIPKDFHGLRRIESRRGNRAWIKRTSLITCAWKPNPISCVAKYSYLDLRHREWGSQCARQCAVPTLFPCWPRGQTRKIGCPDDSCWHGMAYWPWLCDPNVSGCLDAVCLVSELDSASQHTKSLPQYLKDILNLRWIDLVRGAENIKSKLKIVNILPTLQWQWLIRHIPNGASYSDSMANAPPNALRASH